MPLLWNSGLALGAFAIFHSSKAAFWSFFFVIFKEGSASSVTLPIVFFFSLCKMVPIVASFRMWMFTKHVHVVRCYRDKGQLVATARNKCRKGGW